MAQIQEIRRVRDVMSSPAITVALDTKIQEIARLMRENQISGVPVVSQNGKLVGIVTELDLLARHAPVKTPQYLAVLSGLIPVNLEDYRRYKEQLRHILAVNAEQLMSDKVVTVSPNTEIDRAIEIMLDPTLFLLPVMDDGKLVGVVTRTDLVRLIEELEMLPD
jgi:CBS domain-containing protein